MARWSEAIHDELRERFYEGQQDIFEALAEAPDTSKDARCKKCGKPWNGEDARSTPMKAFQRGCWYVSNSLIRCPPCHWEKYTNVGS